MSTPGTIMKLSTDLLKLESSFLDLKSLSEQAKVCRSLRITSRAQLPFAAAAKLLDYVLNINDANRKKILDLIHAPIESNKSIILIRADGDVRHFSSKQKKEVIRLREKNVSPLEAAALSGDFFLVKILSDALPDDQKPEAGLQLLALKQRQDYLSAFFNLQKYYHSYIKDPTSLKDYRISPLWEQVGEGHKKLSNFGLQVFSNPVSFESQDLDLTKEPLRSFHFFEEYFDDEEPNSFFRDIGMDLDAIGTGTGYALYKVNLSECQHRTGQYYKSISPIWNPPAKSDSKVVDRLCKLIPQQLDNTAVNLLKYEPKDVKDTTDAKKQLKNSASSSKKARTD